MRIHSQSIERSFEALSCFKTWLAWRSLLLTCFLLRKSIFKSKSKPCSQVPTGKVCSETRPLSKSRTTLQELAL